MADKKKSVRRVNRQDRKSKIEVDHSRFMPKRPADFPDLSDIDIPDPDEIALESLQQMDDVMRPLVVTPQAERFPQLPSDDDIELHPKPKVPPIEIRTRHSRRNNMITLIFSLLTLGVCAVFSVIWVDPQSSLNLLSPSTPFQIVTATIDTNPVFVVSPQPTLAEGDPTLTPDLADLQPFAIAPEGVLYVSNQNGRDCNWASIGGSVNSPTGDPLPGYGVKVSGDSVSATVYSGTNGTFGEGGFELNLGGAPMFANFKVQLVTTAGAPLSEELIVTTRDDCNENVAIVNFVQR